MTLAIIIVVTLLYMFVGSRVARNKYAIENARYQGLMPGYNDRVAEYNRLVRVMDKIPHGGGCNLRFSSLRAAGCDCQSKAKWMEANDARKEFGEPDEPKKPKPPMLVMMVWPFVSVDSYLRTGPVRQYIPELTESLERQELERQ